MSAIIAQTKYKINEIEKLNKSYSSNTRPFNRKFGGKFLCITKTKTTFFVPGVVH